MCIYVKKSAASGSEWAKEDKTLAQTKTQNHNNGKTNKQKQTEGNQWGLSNDKWLTHDKWGID